MILKYQEYILIAVLFLLLILVAPFDYQWTKDLAMLPSGDLVYFFHQSIFEKGVIGYTDFGIFFYIGTLTLYIYYHLKGRHLYPDSSKKLGFILASGLIIGLIVVHGLKISWGRARPYLVFSEKYDYSPWYLPGNLDLTTFTHSGSFPSGHTATTLWMISVWFLIEYRKNRSKNIDLFSMLWLILAILQTTATGITRSIIADHWVSDCLASLVFGFLTIGICFRFLVLERSNKESSNFFELKWALKIIGLGILACVVIWSARYGFQAMPIF